MWKTLSNLFRRRRSPLYGACYDEAQYRTRCLRDAGLKAETIIVTTATPTLNHALTRMALPSGEYWYYDPATRAWANQYSAEYTEICTAEAIS